MKISDFIDKMTEGELQSFSKMSGFYEVDELQDASYLFKQEFEFDTKVNGYDLCLDCGMAVIVKEDKLIAVLSEDSGIEPFVFDGVIIVPGRDYISLFSTKSGESKREAIR